MLPTLLLSLALWMPPGVEQQIRSVPAGAPVELRLKDGSKFRGWVGDVTESGFVLTHERKNRLERKPIAFEEVRTLKLVKSVRHSHTARNILIGVGIGAAALFAAAAALVAYTW
jgi:hypothetical protein